MNEARPELVVVQPSDIQIQALEAVRLVEAEYGLPNLKPCIAFLLDGNIGGAGRHDAAFVIAIECRRIGLIEREAKPVLVRWAKKIGYAQRAACQPIRNAFAKKPDGSWRYYPPGVLKKPGHTYDRVLSAICADVGCPANCGPYANLNRGLRGQGFAQFEKLGWPAYLRKQRHAAAIDYYRAICEVEDERGFAAGARMFVSYRQLAARAGRDHRHAGDNLRVLYTRGLLRSFQRGSGSGPRAHDRKASEVERWVPVPNPPLRHTNTAITTGGHSPPQIGGQPPPQIGGQPPPNIGGRREGK